MPGFFFPDKVDGKDNGEGDDDTEMKTEKEVNKLKEM